MAHNLATINGKISMAYAGESPWHHLGNRLGGLANVDEALVAANLDWQVGLEPVFLRDAREVPNRRAVVRDIDSAILGTVGPSYTPVQNREAFGILEDACGSYGVTIESAGALGEGERVWMLAKMNQSVAPIPGDTINGYFLITSSHDGTGAHTGRLTPIRVVCQNTLTLAMRGTEKAAFIRIPHTSGASERLAEAKRLVNTMTEALQAANKTFADLAAVKLSRKDIIRAVETLLPAPDPAQRKTFQFDPNGPLTAGQKAALTRRANSPDDRGISEALAKKRAVIVNLVDQGKGHELAKRTAWGLYNAVVEYVDHVWPYEDATAQNDRMESAIFGSGDALKLRALRQLVAA